jgi:hypothetical protein
VHRTLWTLLADACTDDITTTNNAAAALENFISCFPHIPDHKKRATTLISLLGARTKIKLPTAIRSIRLLCAGVSFVSRAE